MTVDDCVEFFEHSLANVQRILQVMLNGVGKLVIFNLNLEVCDDNLQGPRPWPIRKTLPWRYRDELIS